MKRILALLVALVLVGSASVVFAENVAKSDAYAGKTLRIVGPGGISSAKPDSVTGDNGTVVPGYNDLFNAFVEDYPGVTIEFTPATWTDWHANLRTAAVGESADILLHGSMLTDICFDLTDYLIRDAWVLDYLSGKPEQYRYDEENYTVYKPTGLSYCLNPYYALIDLRILEHYGVKAPEKGWTWDDLMAIAEACTGTDPVTGVETKGCYMLKTEINKGMTCYLAAKGLKLQTYHDYKWDMEVHFTDPEIMAAFEFFAKLVNLGGSGYLEKIGRDKYGSAENDIAILVSENMYSDLKMIAAAGLEDSFIFMPLPVNENEPEKSDSNASGYAGSSSIASAYNAKEPDLAWEFIKWLVTDEYAQEWIVANKRCPATYYGVKCLIDSNAQYTSFCEAYNDIMSNFWDNWTIDQFNRIDTGISELGAIVEMYMAEYIRGEVDMQTACESMAADFAEVAQMNHK